MQIVIMVGATIPLGGGLAETKLKLDGFVVFFTESGHWYWTNNEQWSADDHKGYLYSATKNKWVYFKRGKIMEGLFLIIQSKNGQNSNNLTHKLFFL